ncbi:MAG: PAS domain-containing protein [Candidatus Omnitrophica bacterium]|nr:PAS domain-containing protein [Candidatus Omnitrophota bacterium]
MNHINIGYYRYRSRDGVILSMNKGFIKILDLELRESDLIGRSLNELLIYVEGEESIRKRLSGARELRNYEYHFKTLKGADKYVLHNSYIERDHVAGEEVVEALVQDITEEKLAYEKMRESQERYEKLFKNSGDIVIICGMKDFKIEEINPVMQVITGFTEKDIIGTHLENIISPTDKKELKTIREDILFKGGARLETSFICKNNGQKDVIITFSAVKLKDDEVVLAVAKDVSDFVKDKAEQKIRKKELENFWKASIEREERIKDLRIEVEKLKKAQKQ